MNFFAKIEVEEAFDAFGTAHITALCIMLAIIALLVIFKNKINANQKASNTIRYTIAIIFILQQIAFTTWKIAIGEYQLSEILPCHLCAITIYMSVYSLLSRDKRLYPLIYFTGFCGALQALLTPSMSGYNFPHFRFFEYFTSHSTIIIVIVYFLITDGIQIKAKEFIKSFLSLQVLGIFAMIVNLLTGGNYMFLAYKPDSSSVFNLLADWPYYILQLELVAFVFMAIFSVPYLIKYKKEFFNIKLSSNKKDK
ncbi:MAG: TIGR02206 family membrane protein [Bacillota bacterium]